MQNKRTRGFKVVIMALVILLVVAILPPSAIRAIDLDQEGSIKVAPGNAVTEEDQVANLVLDVYKIADAEALPGQDSFKPVLIAPFTGIASGDDWWKDENIDWEAIAQKAAEIAVKDENKPVVSEDFKNVELTISGLEMGLYLILARGTDVEGDYYTTIDDKLVTIGQSDYYYYYFSPILLSLPTKTPKDGTIGTAYDYGDWLYEAAVELKAVSEPRFGGLEIIKDLLTYESKEPAYFVFEIKSEDFLDYQGLSFDAPGEKRIQVDGLKAGASVTVTEVYSGSHYELVTAASQTVEIVGDEIVTVRFENKDYPGDNGGHGIVNSFTYENGKWNWEKKTDNEAKEMVK